MGGYREVRISAGNRDRDGEENTFTMKSMKEEWKYGNRKNKFLFLFSALSSFLSSFMLFMLFMVNVFLYLSVSFRVCVIV
jgi:hypothetical protein